MAGVFVRFERLTASQEFGTADEYATATVFLTFYTNGKPHSGLHLTVKQTLGSAYATHPLEVGKIDGLDEPHDYSRFRSAVEDYYRECIGAQGKMVRFEQGASGHLERLDISRYKMVSLTGEKIKDVQLECRNDLVMKCKCGSMGKLNAAPIDLSISVAVSDSGKAEAIDATGKFNGITRCTACKGDQYQLFLNTNCFALDEGDERMTLKGLVDEALKRGLISFS